jgi:hypothetical protein
VANNTFIAKIIRKYTAAIVSVEIKEQLALRVGGEEF